MTSTKPYPGHAPSHTDRPRAYPWADVIAALVAGRDLTDADAAWAMRQMVCGDATSAQVAGLLTAMRAKGEAAGELAGMVRALHEHAVSVPIPGPIVDVVGTGGDGTGAVNISTMAAIVVAATGATVVKHGGRAASSPSGGSADVVEHLGVPLELTSEQAVHVAAEAGITFLFAPRFNPGLRHVATVRRELGVPMAFNILGPLINPADPGYQVVGVADPRFLPVIAEVLAARGRSALVVRGQDGLDKLTTGATSTVWLVRDGVATPSVLDPSDLGIAHADVAALRGGSAADNARVVHDLLDGQRGPIRDVVLLNAAAALVTLDLSRDPLVEQLAAAMVRCANAIDSGAARATLNRWITVARGVVDS